MCNLEQLMILGLQGSCLLSGMDFFFFLSDMDLTGQTEDMIEPALHICSSSRFSLWHPLTRGVWSHAFRSL